MGKNIDLGVALGMPDDEDYEFIKRRIEQYERKYPGELAANRRDALAAKQQSKRNKYGQLSNDGMRHALVLPTELYLFFKKHYPSIIGPNRSKRHVAWLLRKFPILGGSEKF